MIPHDLTFVLGGIRSGKSMYAENIAYESGLPVTYIATSSVEDDEFTARIEKHRIRRPLSWNNVHSSIELADTLHRLNYPHICVLVECLGMWLANLLCPIKDIACNNEQYEGYANALEIALRSFSSKLIVVSNEIGLGVLPNSGFTRRYVDELGQLNQRVAKLATQVILVVSGLPVIIKKQE